MIVAWKYPSKESPEVSHWGSFNQDCVRWSWVIWMHCLYYLCYFHLLIPIRGQMPDSRQKWPSRLIQYHARYIWGQKMQTLVCMLKCVDGQMVSCSAIWSMIYCMPWENRKKSLKILQPVQIIRNELPHQIYKALRSYQFTQGTMLKLITILGTFSKHMLWIQRPYAWKIH